jgi:hypothetical protein
MLMSFQGISQDEKSKWKLQFSAGVNAPDKDGLITGYEAKSLNFPSINLGVLHMFSRIWGAKLDYGFYRFSNTDTSPEFKTNYSRVNAQIVYDGIMELGFLPMGIGMIGHAGPGYTVINPLGNFGDNGHSYLNVMAGIEIHYLAADTFTIFTDFSYIMGLSGNKTYNPISEGIGTFNGNLFAVTVGVSVSLSGCYYCD